MGSLSYQALESLWTSAGGSQALAPTMAAIAIAESGGNPSALNNNPLTKDYSVGLWQINYYGGLYGPRSQQFGSPSALLASPTAQARAAVSIANQQGLSAWSTYTSGAYRQYLNGSNYGGTGAVPVSSTSGTPVSDSKPADCLFGVSLPIVGYTCILTKGNGRAIVGTLLVTAGGIVGGVGLIILAAYGLKRSGALDQAAAAAAVVPGGQPVAGVLAASAHRVRAQPTPRRKTPKPKQTQSTPTEQPAKGD